MGGFMTTDKFRQSAALLSEPFGWNFLPFVFMFLRLKWKGAV